MRLHASCAARANGAVLLLGPPGSGKSDLTLRLIASGWLLVADDQVDLAAEAGRLVVRAPSSLAGRLEMRGLGVFEGIPTAPGATLRLAVRLQARDSVSRLPDPATFACLGIEVPQVALHAFDASAGLKVAWALDAAEGRAHQAAGAFARAA